MRVMARSTDLTMASLDELRTEANKKITGQIPSDDAGGDGSMDRPVPRLYRSVRMKRATH